MKQALIFKFWVIFDKVMSVYSQKIAKNPSKIFFLVPFQICKFSQNTSISGIAWSNYEKKKKKKHSEILSLWAFK